MQLKEMPGHVTGRAWHQTRQPPWHIGDRAGSRLASAAWLTSWSVGLRQLGQTQGYMHSSTVKRRTTRENHPVLNCDGHRQTRHADLLKCMDRVHHWLFDESSPSWEAQVRELCLGVISHKGRMCVSLVKKSHKIRKASSNRY